MRTRFPPEPNGYLHIGHLKAIVADFEGIKNPNNDIVCNLRFDDTNPDNESDEFRNAILNDLEWLGYNPAFVTSTSDYFPQLYRFMIWLLKTNQAYFEWGNIASQREKGDPSPTRNCSDLSNLDVHADTAIVPCVRVKIDPNHPNTPMRDPVIYRYKKTVGTWLPTYDVSHPIVDYLEKITHSFCTREFFIRRDLYFWFVDKFINYEKAELDKKPSPIPEVFEFNRLEIEGVKLSKRYIIKEIEEGNVSGFDDPSLFTIAGLRNRGHSPKALLHFIKNYISYVAGDGGTIPIHTFEHAIRQFYEKDTFRRFAIPKDETFKVTIDNYIPQVVKRPNHPEFDLGNRVFTMSENVLINKADFKYDGNKKYKRIKGNGNRVFLKYGPMITYSSHTEDSLNVTTITEGKANSAIQWLSESDFIELPDTSGKIWLCESDVVHLNNVIQFERCGYVRICDGIIKYIMDLKSSYKD
jgi:glutaminyl-tRNA synthetase